MRQKGENVRRIAEALEAPEAVVEDAAERNRGYTASRYPDAAKGVAPCLGSQATLPMFCRARIMTGV